MQQNFILFLEFSNLHGLIPSCTFIRFWKNYLPTRLFNHRLLLWNLRVGRLFFHPTRSYSILHVYCFWQKFPSYTFIPSYRFIRDSKVHYVFSLLIFLRSKAIAPTSCLNFLMIFAFLELSYLTFKMRFHFWSYATCMETFIY